jgi:lysylphosphatidylglycerol synthetase-like protein (DUF2156 family)
VGLGGRRLRRPRRRLQRRGARRGGGRELLEPLYGFRSLEAFKATFSPRHVALHLVFRDEAALPRISLALTEAHLPDASTADLVRAGFGAVAGD